MRFRGLGARGFGVWGLGAKGKGKLGDMCRCSHVARFVGYHEGQHGSC